MGPASMVKAPRMPRKSRRVWGASTAALVIAAGVTTLPAVPAQADNTISAADQPYFGYYHLDQARAKGYTGKGVTIAIVDGEADATVPELNGVDIHNKSTCEVTSSASSKTHGTAVASILVSSVYGVAPESSLLTYQIPATSRGDSASPACAGAQNGLSKVSIPWVLNQAMDDGAQIVNFSASSSLQGDELKWTVARAMTKGVIITAAAGNEATDENSTSLSQWSGVVGVSAIGIDGNSSWGQGVSTTAVGGPVKMHDFATNQIVESSGTSFSSPIVAGVLALARQKWPSATSNQLLQLLVKTGLNPDHTWNQYTGYGGIDPGAILNTDPTTLPDVNPLADKGNGSSPTPDEVQQYADGVVSPLQIVNDNSYSYRGFDESLITDPLVTVPTHLGTSPRYHAK